MACSDVKERFHVLILLLMILMRNMAEFDWQFGNFEHFWYQLAIKT